MISVIIPTYNGEKTLERAIKSVLDQGYDTEILICDDCSTDGTLDIARRYNCRIFVNESNSGGPNKGRNVGIDNAKGEYVCFLDQDDEWLQYKLTIQLLQRGDPDIVYSQYEGAEWEPSPDIYQTLLHRDKTYGWPYMSSLMIKNHNIPKFEEYFGQLDYDWMLALTKDRKCVQVEPVVRRYVDGKNLSLNPQYRKRDFYIGLLLADENIKTMKRWYASRARYYYSIGDMIMARFYFKRGTIDWKTVLYILTSYSKPLSTIVKQNFRVFG